MLDTLILAWIFIFLLFLCIRIQRPKNFPPGPRPVPLFGNLFQLNISSPLKDFERLAQRYGSVYSLYFGGRPAVILTGFKAVKEALVIKAADFSGRPQNIIMNNLTQGNGVVFLDYGPAWKEHRRFSLTILRNFGMGKRSMEDRILGEIEHLVARLEESAGGCINPQTLFHKVASNVIYQVLYSTRYDYHDKTLQEYVNYFTKITKIAGGPWGMIFDTLPIVRVLPLPFKKAFTYFEEIKKMIASKVSKHRTSRAPGEPENFVDCYLDVLDQGANGGAYFNDADLVRTIMDIHGGGTETTSNTLLSAFLYLMTKPDIQERCQKEIDEVLEGKAHASFEDRHKMPYTQAVIHECQRIASTFPPSVQHCTTRDTELMGYSDHPREFNPANFLNEQGQFEKPYAFIPFSIGPRVCLGEGLARMELFLILVSLLHRFYFFWPEDAGEPDFTPVFGVTLTPKPYRMGLRLR